ncbi:MAG: thiamine-monophosphate kinase [Candidatus Omnitrophica bacterium]|nr:thiamine-monophosphate kinase [Candidatus Omnitrophota bacterium]
MKELQLIDQIRKRSGKAGRGVKIGIGDDCAVLDCKRDEYILWASDMLAEGTHFQVKDGYKRIGRKAVSVNISDIAAMGGTPKYILISIGVTKKMGAKAIKGIYDGIFEVCREYGIKVIGGDTVSSGKLVIDVSIIGFARKRNLVTRSGAKEKDLILITGPVRDGKKEHLDFSPRMKEAEELTKNYKITSMIDTSDGISMDLMRISSESKVGCRLYSDAVPLSGGLSLESALYYGESFELLFTMASGEARKLFKNMGRRKEAPKYFVIGEITKKKNGLVLVGKEGRVSKLKPKGFRHI